MPIAPQVTTFRAALLALLLAATGAPGALIPEHVAQSVGLTRAWHTQAALDPSTQSVVDAVLADGTLLVLTTGGKLQAIDAETGATRWAERFGEPNTTVLGPGVGDGQVALIVGSTAYVCELDTGRLVMSRSVESAPGAAPTLDGLHVFVPLLRGKLAAYPIDSAIAPPFRVASPGRLWAQPLLVADRVIWSTSRGELHAASAIDGSPVYRMQLSGELAGKPSAIEEALYFATVDGDVYAIDGERGTVRWRHPLGASIQIPPVGLIDQVYVSDMNNRLHAFDAQAGSLQWSFDGADQFVSATDERVYAVGPTGGLVVLDRETGRLIASWPPAGKLMPITNTVDDRLFFVSESGRVQAFHESGRDTPYRHDGATPAEAGEAADAAASEEPAADEDPFAADAPDEPAVEVPADDEPEEEDDPFADPFADDAASDDEDDPFAF